ncbi:MAG: NTP transferase domain-containing protein, partial [Myxococcales bacterium]|nr:NTP transferase domain-containing protein [Myxococcales bacterium]
MALDPLPPLEEKGARVRAMFNRIAPRYDLLNRLLSAGLDQRWRRDALDRIRVGRGDRVVDLACGTGDLAELSTARGAQVVVPAEPPAEMKDSVRLGLEWAESRRPQSDDAWLVAPADMPGLNAQIIDRLIAAHEAGLGSPCIRAPRHGTKRGHPVLFPWPLAAEVAHLGADVIAIEPPGGSPARFDPSHDRNSYQWQAYARGKKSLVLDLEAAAGRERLAELELIYDTAPVALCLMDTNLRFLRINRWLADINGLSQKEHIGRTLREIVPEIAESMEEVYARVIETGVPVIDVLATGATPAHPETNRHHLANYYPLKSED